MGSSRAFLRGGSARFYGYSLVHVPAEHSPRCTAPASLPGEAQTPCSAAGGLCSPAGLEGDAIADVSSGFGKAHVLGKFEGAAELV